MMDNLLILPVVTQLFLAIISLLLLRHYKLQRVFSVVGSLLALFFAIDLFAKVWNTGILTMNAGNWKAPFGIVFVADTFSSTMVLLTSIAGFAVSIFSTASVSHQRAHYGYFAIYHFLLMGLSGAFLTGDILDRKSVV